MIYFILIFILNLFSPTYATELQPTKVFSNSIIVINGENSIAITSDNDKYRGILTQIDWGQIPDFGLPKNEIHTIQVLSRTLLKHSNSHISLSPTKWRFIADSWIKDYSGTIPYLEKMKFLPKTITNKLQMNNDLYMYQNELGYYLDKDTLSSGIYNAINNAEDNVISKIIIISSEENQQVYDMSRKLDTIILQEEILKTVDITPIDKKEIESTPIVITNYTNTTQTSTSTTEQTNIMPSSSTNYESIIDKSINTSVDKRENLAND